MIKFLTCTSVFIISFLLTEQVYSQNRITLSGSVTDSSKKPISLVTVRFFKQDNLQAPLQTTLSQDDGSFQFTKIDAGNYTLTFTHTGFAALKQEITVKAGADIKTEPVIMAKVTGTLNEVVVKSQRPMVEQGDDRTIFNL